MGRKRSTSSPDQIELFPEPQPARYGNGRRGQPLFIPRLLAAPAAQLTVEKKDSLKTGHAILVKWADLEASGKLEEMNETALEGEFLTEVFGQALGYTLFSKNLSLWDLQPKWGVNGGTADAAIGEFPLPGPTKPRAVVELKGPTVDLDRDRSQGRTPVQQLWDYLNAVPECPWGILCNYVSFRLYHRTRGWRAYELFTLADLKKPEVFNHFYAIFERGALLASFGKRPRADVLLEETDQRQREVGDELYDRYSKVRLDLIHHLHARQNKSVDRAIRIGQLLLDRIMFVAFCEDRDLLPPKTLDRTWRELSPLQKVTNPRWRNFLDLFRAIDTGHPHLRLEPGFNGNLFKPHEADDLQLHDDWTDFFRGVGEYDFRNEVTVEVLGHLFEKSVTELERLRVGGLFGIESVETEPGRMQKSAQRKRYGIFYTPPEFTRFLVQRTVGEVIRERFVEIGKRHDLKGEVRAASDAPRGYWQECYDALREIKVCDPACGSGAFLIRAYDFLWEQYNDVIDNLEHLGVAEAEQLRESVPDTILSENLFGVDLSEEAVEISQLSLWIRTARRHRTLADLSHNIVCGNSLVDDPKVDTKALDWRKTFPQVFDRPESGFDAVIGNPPWERLKLQEREFFSLTDPDIAGAVSAATRRQMIAKLERKNPALYGRYKEAKTRAESVLDFARNSGRFPLTGKGDVNTYMLFAELARTLVAPAGRVGLLVPSGIATDDTTKEFFQDLIESQSLICLYDFENRKLIFKDVDNRFKFCTLVIGGSEVKTKTADFVFFAHQMEDLEEKKRHIPLTAKDFALLNPNTRTCPIFRTRRDAEITKAIYDRVPVLIDESRKQGGNPWAIKFLTMFHQTNDAELFHTADQLKKMGLKLDGNRWKKGKTVFLPLYEAKMVQAYDHRAAGVVVETDKWMRQGQTVKTSLVAHQNPEFTVTPRWWVRDDEVLSKLGEYSAPAFLCYKDVTSPTNERTMIASMMPVAAVVNSAPLVLTCNDVGPRQACCLLANLNSFGLDFVARQKVGNVHLNFFIVEQFPIFPSDAYEDRKPWTGRQTLERWVSDRVLKLTCTANDMVPLAEAAGFKEGVHKWKPEERAQLRAELDASFFLLYGLDRDDTEYVLSTFNVAQHPDYELGEPSGDAILAAYDALINGESAGR